MSTIVQAEPREKTLYPPLPPADACIVIIFGASGDLTRRKLIPGLYELDSAGCMTCFEVLGVARTPMDDDRFRNELREFASRSSDIHDFDPSRWERFAKRIHYFPGDLYDPAFYEKLRERLGEMRTEWARDNHLFYLATPPSAAVPIIEGLKSSGLNKNDDGWARIIIEKPFGNDLQSARSLNQAVLDVFNENSVYRIDHYLGKETVQNILMFRFGNSIYEPVWNRNYVDYIEITAAEKIGIGSRASFYEGTGALRDVVANHMLQLLTLTAMEPPVAFDADAVRQQKVNVLRSIPPMNIEQVAHCTVRGQYGPGIVDGKPVPGYREEQGVNQHSSTETFAAVKFKIENWRWAGVPFYVRAGKRLAGHLTDVRIHFKRTPQALFARTPEESIAPNVLNLRIQPDEGISISFVAKRPGLEMKAIPVQANFSYEQFGAKSPTAYHTLLLDAMRGDPTLFTRGDEAEHEWRIITPIEDAWSELPRPDFPNYAAGSEGPDCSQLFEDSQQFHPLKE
jgi:glucose-6-phosphate 1-dehydrogenase